ncbi:hypothetical protein YC2023_050367 [Brassica napus]
MAGDALISLSSASLASVSILMSEWGSSDFEFNQLIARIDILDLEYGLPVQVRDTALNIGNHNSIPKSDVNRELFAEEHDQRTRAGLDYESSFGKIRPNDTIGIIQRTTPHYKRNRAHICSFYIRGECTKGDECPYRHEMHATGEHQSTEAAVTGSTQ